MDKESLIASFNSKKAQFNISFDLKDKQIDVALPVLKGRNVIGFLPTGFGKTLCMILPTIIKSEEHPITIIISPLTSLIDDQMLSLRTFNISCAKISSEMEKETVSDIRNGKFQVVFSSPESILKPQWKKILMSDIWQSRLNLIAIDEVHCISEWGEDFRKEYQALSELRSFFTAPIMAVTGTATPKVKNDIMQYMQLTPDDTDTVFMSPDRPNIYLQFQKRHTNDYEESLSWLIENIKFHNKNSKKLIIYCRSIDRVAEVYLSLKDSLGENAYVDKKKEMFHKSTHQVSKERMLLDFKSENSRIRCIIATVALGMGLDVRGVDLIVHIGCPKSALSYWQEAGRCARDGRVGMSYVLYDGFTLSLKTTDNDIREIIKNDGNKCIRQKIMQKLSVEDGIEKPTEVCEGCKDVRCKCSACNCCAVCCEICPCQKRCKFCVESFLNSETVTEVDEN